MSHLLPLSLVALATLSSISAQASENDKSTQFETISIIGSKEAVNTLPGSGNYLSEEELKKFEFSDIMRVLAATPGVYVQEEDGYGLRPNIGMRGTGSSRSEKISIMEDGVLMAPAPYSASSAYYFPTIGRMEAVEILKGSAAVKYGPRTTGGVINMRSRAIPDSFLGSLNLSAGSDGFGKVHGVVGDKGENVGSVLEFYRYQADGFKNLPNGDDTGFEKNDVLFKVGGNLGEHHLELKLKYSDEESDETYLGLTQEDFEKSPYKRYSASMLDNMQTTHKSAQVNYAYELSDNVNLSAIAYANEFSRNWYKAAKVDGNKLGKGAEEAASAFDEAGTGSLSVDVKANSRDYTSKGMQAELAFAMGEHNITTGLRLHKDDVDRFQWVDEHLIDSNYNATLTNAGTPGTDSNRLSDATAKTAFVHGEFNFEQLVITGGLRYEDIATTYVDFDKNNPTRDPAIALKKDLANNQYILVPALGATYQFNDEVVLLAGIQKGYEPASPSNASAEPEESINIETGLRFNAEQLSAEAIYFISDYENMHGNCTANQGCDEDLIGNQYNAGETKVSGLELSLGYEGQLQGFDFPLTLSYTYTDAKFENTHDSKVWGSVTAGDVIPYIAKNQLSITAGIAKENLSLNLQGRYRDEITTQSGTTDDLIASHTIWDLSSRYQIDQKQHVYLTLDNVFDKVYMANRSNGGIQVGKPRSLQIGYSMNF